MSSWTLAQVAGCGPSTMFVYLLNKYTCVEVSLMCLRQVHRRDDFSDPKDAHIVILMHSHFWRHTLIHHHRSMTIGLNIDVPVTSEEEQNTSHDSTYS